MANSLIIGRQARLAVVLLAGASLAACASMTPRYASRNDGRPVAPSPGQGEYKVGKPYQVAGVWYVPREEPNYDRTGTASWYGDEFHMKATANGETFDMNAVTAAHTTLPLPSMVEVTNLDNGRKLIVRVNDRGPFVGDRLIDLSREAARQLGYDRQGLAHVRVRYVGPAPLLGPDGGARYANAKPLPTRLPAPIPVSMARAGGDPAMEMASASGSRAAPPEPLAPGMTAPRAAAVTSQALPPITGSAISDAPIGAVNAASAMPVASAGTASALRVQAGAFASEANARIAVSQLSRAGAATIEPLQRDGSTLYRVVMPAPADEAAAYALRDKVAEIGFVDARVVRTF